MSRELFCQIFFWVLFVRLSLLSSAPKRLNLLYQNLVLFFFFIIIIFSFHFIIDG
jgi:hypothetical protein